MELSFQTLPMRYLGNPIQGSQTQEQTAEVIVPDSCPDVARIVYTSASVIVRGKECRTGSVLVSGGIRASGARIVTYGAPVLPGAMFLLGYFEDGTPICGLPGCVMYAGATIFDLALPRIAAGVELTRRDFAVMGEGGLCLGCKPCHWPNCPFGK